MLFDICLRFVYTAFTPADSTSAKYEGDCRVIDKGLSYLILSLMCLHGGCPMSEPTSPLTKEQWIERLYAWAVERWGQARADAIRAEIEATAQHLVTVAA